MLLRGALGDLELVRFVHSVGTVGAATNFATVLAVAENLRTASQQSEVTSKTFTYAPSGLATGFISDVTAHTSSGDHV